MKNSILLKHTAAVHSSAPLTLIQRKSINCLLKNAMMENCILDDVYHSVKISDLMVAIGYSKDNRSFNDDLKQSLLSLSELNIKWNVLGKDKRGKVVGQSPYLSGIEIGNGVVRYTFSKEIRDRFFKPHLYAKLDLQYQKNFKMKSSMPLWELVCEDLSIKNVLTTFTAWIKYENFFSLMGIDGDFYLKNYALFKNKILKPCISEINEKSDVIIELEEKRGPYKRLTDLRFKVTKKNIQDLWEDVEELFPSSIEIMDPAEEGSNILKRLELFVPTKTAKSLMKQYESYAVKDALDFFEQELRVRGEQINNPVAFFKKTIAEGWVLPEVLQSRMVKEAPDKSLLTQGAIQQLEESDLCKGIRTSLLSSIGDHNYNAWFLDTIFCIQQDILEICAASNFYAEWLDLHYSKTLKDVATKVFPELSITFKVRDQA